MAGRAGRRLTPQDQEQMHEARKAAREAKRITGFPIGTRVRVHDRSRFNGRRGVVASHNMGEVGVTFGHGPPIWFVPGELERLDSGVAKGVATALRVVS